MPCLRCDSPHTIDAHLIPRAMANEVASKTGEKHIIAYSASDKFRRTNTGLYDSDILCGSCDNHLGKNENYVIETMRKVRAQFPKHGTLAKSPINDGNVFVRFAAGIAWKYSVAKPGFGRINVGPYGDILANVAFSDEAIPDSIDLAMIYMQSGVDEVFFYRTPLPDRQSGVNLIRFSVGSFLYLLKVDKRPNPPDPPSQVWLRNKSAVVFPVLPAHEFEEWTKPFGIRGRPQVRSYFDRFQK
jgi:hypothetical protein